MNILPDPVRNLLTSRQWGYQGLRIVILAVLAWWLMGSSDLLARFGLTSEWPNTDFSRHSVPMSEITPGGPGKDGIPAIDHPKFIKASGSILWLDESEPVIALFIGGKAKAYPVQILMWHEIVNDWLAGVPVAVTFCPLCNASVVFDRRLDDTVLDFGTTGRLRYSDLVMYDRQTESWWQQFIGEGIVGFYTERKLSMIPSRIMSWGDFRAGWPEGYVLSKETGYSRNYGVNPYKGYDDIKQTPFLLDVKPDSRLPPMERVAVVNISGVYKAYPYTVLTQEKVLHDQVNGQPVVLLTRKNTRSALDRKLIRKSRMIISVQAFKPAIKGSQLTFIAHENGDIFDQQTGSQWLISGRAVKGELKGHQLEPITTETYFAFSWLVFRPETEIFRSSDEEPDRDKVSESAFQGL